LKQPYQIAAVHREELFVGGDAVDEEPGFTGKVIRGVLPDAARPFAEERQWKKRARSRSMSLIARQVPSRLPRSENRIAALRSAISSAKCATSDREPDSNFQSAASPRIEWRLSVGERGDVLHDDLDIPCKPLQDVRRMDHLSLQLW
jgi:hypothetical protein